MKALLGFGLVALLVGVASCTKKNGIMKEVDENPLTSAFVEVISGGEISKEAMFWGRMQTICFIIGGACLAVYYFTREEQI